MATALTEQRVSRKRAQEDVKLLANRIQLLKAEEEKVSGFRSEGLLLMRCAGLEKDRGHQEEGRRNPQCAHPKHGEPRTQGGG